SYAASATQGGSVIGDFQLVQAMLADQKVGVEAGRALVRDTARRYVTGDDRRVGPSVAKLYCTEMAGRAADLAVQVHGGAGYMREVAVERLYRDVRLLRLYEGTSEIQRLIIGGALVRRARSEARWRERGGGAVGGGGSGGRLTWARTVAGEGGPGMPLREGSVVVALAQAVGAPLAGRHLVDLGARVIKVERVEGGVFARGYDHVVAGTGAHFV